LEHIVSFKRIFGAVGVVILMVIVGIVYSAFFPPPETANTASVVHNYSEHADLTPEERKNIGVASDFSTTKPAE
jgi:hypothetical protein